MATATYRISQVYGNSKGGERWDDGTYSGVRKITMTDNGTSLTSLQVHYGLEGRDSTVSGKDFGGFTHGAVSNSRTEYHLDFPDEYLTGMTGYLGTCRDHFVVKSLTFHTNRRRVGPCGPEEGTPFDTRVDNGKIVGFLGTSGSLIDSLAVHIMLLNSEA